jgi:hypothetical protein
MPQQEEDKNAVPKQKGKGKAKDDGNNGKKKQEKEVNKQIINKNPVEVFKLKEGERWDGTFAKKTSAIVYLGPAMNVKCAPIGLFMGIASRIVSMPTAISQQAKSHQ